MRRYFCPQCQSEVYFDNTVCVSCKSSLGYSSSTDSFRALSTLVPLQHGSDNICANHDLISCNWIVEHTETSHFCSSCQHTLVIPDLSTTPNVERWARLERAKRMLFYGLLKFQLPLELDKNTLNGRLQFEFKSDLLSFVGQEAKTITGHKNGVITINIKEADDDVREQQRVQMGEPYRTLIGHLRHEIGHYYWDRLVANTERLDQFRAMFGDERIDYAQALQRHYQFGEQQGWEMRYVSAYASSHPWEDFAETWAHYFHIVDGLETAQSYQINSADVSGGVYESSYEEKDFSTLLSAWVPLTIAMNAMNRSIGNSDFYPFVLSNAISEKLHFVHNLIHHFE